MTIANGNHCYGFHCTCGKTGAGYPSESAAAKAERHHAEHNPTTHNQKGGTR
jgi:hypothetical protein